MGSTWAVRLQDAADVVAWTAKLNAWWWMFTALGLGLFGVGPATAASAVMVRRRAAGDVVRLRDFAEVYRAEFTTANAAIAPGLLVAVLLANNLTWVAGWAPAWVTFATGAALVLAGSACCYLPALYAFYQLRSSHYLLQAVRIAICRPTWTALLVLLTAAIVFASYKLPAVAVFVGVGAWLHTCTWLGLRFFAENEHRLEAGIPPAERSTHNVLGLPSDPLRMH